MQIALKAANESNFIAALTNDEKWAQKELYENQYSRMMAICMRYAGNADQARDLVHDGFIKVLKKISTYKVGTSLNAWISRIITNNCIDNYRKKTIRRTEDIDVVYDLSSNAADAIAQCSAQELIGLVQTLPVTYRMVFNLYVIEGFSHREIGEKIGITESTSRSNLSKARGKLKLLVTQRFKSNWDE